MGPSSFQGTARLQGEATKAIGIFQYYKKLLLTQDFYQKQDLCIGQGGSMHRQVVFVINEERDWGQKGIIKGVKNQMIMVGGADSVEYLQRVRAIFAVWRWVKCLDNPSQILFLE